MSKRIHWIVLGGLLLASVSTAYATDGYSLTTGATYSSGNYGSSITTDIWSAPFTAGYQAGRWTLKLTVPYVSVHGSGDVIPGTGLVDNNNPLGRGLGDLLGGGATPGATQQPSSTSASGLGDVVASAGYTLFYSDDRTAAITLTGKVKFGTADVNKGLGTGQNDYGVSVDGYKTFGQWTPFGGVGWMNYGSSPYIRLDNGMNANTGVDYRLESSDSIGVYYNYRQPIAVGGASQGEVTAYWNHKIHDSFRLQTYALGGTTKGSPDWGGGASISYGF